ncbi:CaiB/BaiF CoA transferase family protein [Caproicibacter sp. BJN0012]|uniref:CaiB/BaiF CoA transferase family protein n=1 Tax=Caproicibacter sp. BJN0012 TaxID=3110227 RepID=UPI002E0F7152
MAGIFEGVKILDFTNNVAGPCGTAMFADLGANVLKVERPVAGDDSRGINPRIEGQSLTFIWCNRGKKSVELALDDPESQELLYRIIQDADVVIESFKPGLMKKFNLDYEKVAKVNPKIIYCSISACGQTGGYRTMPGFDIIAQGMSGLMDLCGDPDGMPVKNGVTIGDYVGAFNAFGSISAALYHRLRTGEGQYIDLSLLDGLISCNTTAENAANLEAHPTRSGPHHGTMAPYGIYMGKNNQCVIIAAFTAGMWNKLCISIGKPEMLEDPDFATSGMRVRNLKRLVAVLEEWLRQFDNIDDAVRIMKDGGVACCKIRSTYEVVHDPVLWERGTFVEIPTQPSFQKIKSVKTRGPWIRFSKTPAEMKRAPDLGEHNYEILEEYGWDKNKIDAMEAKWSGKFKKQ